MKQLILGGTRSGKSEYAEQQAQACGLPVGYVATARSFDEEMARRIALHRERRPADWLLVEEPLELAALLRREAAVDRCLLVDCLTLWLTNVLMLEDEAREQQLIDDFLAAVAQAPGHIVLVSNELSLGVVPVGSFTRRFVDQAGRLHQQLARQVDQVTLVVAGLPLALKC